MKPITIFRGTTGLNTVDDPARIPMHSNGVNDVAEIVNMTIDRSGRPMTRPGLVKLQSGAFHSLFCDGGDCFVMQGDSLYRVATDGSLQGIRSGMVEGRRVAFAQSGPYTYYSNGIDRGRIKDGLSTVWDKGTYTGPDTTRAFTGPVSGDHLGIFSGRMFISLDNVLLWSEPFNFDLFDQAEGFVQFHSKILFIQPMSTGLFVSTENNVYFLAPNESGSFSPIIATPYPGIEWTNAKADISPMELGFEGSGYIAAWASREGAVIGLSTGSAVNINKNKIIYPESAKSGFGAFMGYHFIHGIE